MASSRRGTVPRLKLPARLVGAVAGPLLGEMDARRLMAYAAALGDMTPECTDTLSRRAERPRRLTVDGSPSAC